MNRHRCSKCGRYAPAQSELCVWCKRKAKPGAKQCRKCGRSYAKDRPGEVAGLCHKCADNTRVEILCPTCGKSKRVRYLYLQTHPGCSCEECRYGASRATVSCAECGKPMRTLSRFLRDPSYTPTCQKCRTKRNNELRKVIGHSDSPKKPRPGNSIQVNGCTLVETDRRINVGGYWISRCAQWFECGNAVSCLDAVARRNWIGFTNKAPRMVRGD
jgi:hypothetical protein